MIGWLRRRPGSKPLEGLRIYLASRTARQAEMSAIAEELVSAGAEVTSRWLGGAPLGNKELEPAGRASRLAKADLEDLCRADVCIAFTEKPGSSPGRGGRHTEFGMFFTAFRRSSGTRRGPPPGRA